MIINNECNQYNYCFISALIFLAFMIRNWSRGLVVRCLSRNVPEIMDSDISMSSKENKFALSSTVNLSTISSHHLLRHELKCWHSIMK